MGFKGSVESFSLADVFQNLSMNQQTGTLRVYTVAGEERFIFFENGHVQSLSRGAGKPLVVPDMFLARGLINQAQLDAALARHPETGMAALPCLLEQDALTTEQVNEVTGLVIGEEIFDLFGWDKANFEFNEGPPPNGLFSTQRTGKSAALPISHLIMEAARRVDEWERLRKQVPSFKEVYTLDAAAAKAIEKGEMETDALEQRVASLVDGTRDVEDLFQDSYLFKFEVLNALGGMMQSSLVRPSSLQELSQAEQECLRRNVPKRRIKLLERILVLGGENLRVRRELAEALAREQRVETACIHFTVLAEAELQRKRTEPAMELLRRTLSLSPKHVKAHEQLAAIYAKRGQKREAFVHYHTLFETFRDQNHPREARAAAVAALECDPSHGELRAALIELLLADNQKEAAAQHFEVQGDQAARLGNVKVAADSYRRAMQLAPLNKQLKKKLADVMLTKEDRLARKRKARLALATVAAVAAAVGSLALKEHSNANRFAKAESAAQPVLVLARDAEKNGNYREAKMQYEAAAAMYGPLAQVFSPALRCNEKALQAVRDLRRLAEEMEQSALKYREANARRSDSDLEAAENAAKAKRIYDARDLYNKVLKNSDSSERNAQLAKEGLAKTQQQIDAFEKALSRLRSADPNREFANVDDEFSEKRKLLEDFQGYDKFDAGIVELPLLIQPDTDGVQVFLDGRPVGTVSPGGGREANTFRYPALGMHRFEFKKLGFKTVTLTTGDQRTPRYRLRVEREPALRIDLRPLLGADVTLAGEAACDGGSLFVGTSEGGLLEVREGENPVVRRYSLPGGGGLNKEVYGPLSVYKRPGKETFIVYCTFAGDCIGLKLAGNAFKEAWPQVKAGQTPLSAAPSVIRLKLLTNPVMAMPADKKMILVDCEVGVPAAGSPLDFKGSITSSPVGIDVGSLLVAGVKVGQSAKLLGYSLSDKSIREWSPNLVIGCLRAKPVFFEDELVVGADDGAYYLFKPASPNQPPGRVALENAGALVSEPLILKKRIYAGTVEREGFWCADLVRHETVWRCLVTDLGGVPYSAAVLENTIYFSTDRGRVYALDAERGMVRWSYQLEGGGKIVGPPLVLGRRIHVVTTGGKILGFDE